MVTIASTTTTKKHQDNRAECRIITYTHVYFIDNITIEYLKCFRSSATLFFILFVCLFCS